MNRITTLEPPAPGPATDDDDATSAEEELLFLPGCDIAHIEAMSVNNMTRVIALYHTINAP
jgi:hypothetical protein